MGSLEPRPERALLAARRMRDCGSKSGASPQADTALATAAQVVNRGLAAGPTPRTAAESFPPLASPPTRRRRFLTQPSHLRADCRLSVPELPHPTTVRLSGGPRKSRASRSQVRPKPPRAARVRADFGAFFSI